LIDFRFVVETSSPDFTIITASRNYGRFIGECLESVASQEGVTVEHLVIDARSGDETSEVVGRFPRVHFVSEEDEGMCDGINKGFRRARGKWVMWLNADDRLKPGALKAVKEFAGKNPAADVIYGGWDFVSERGERVRRMTVMPFHKASLIYLGCYIGSTATFLRRKSTIHEGFLLNPSFKYVMDGEFYCRLSAAGKKFAYFHAILADFRIHGENTSLINHGKAKDIEGLLRAEYQFSESRAIKRFYGSSLTGKLMLDSVIHSLLFYLFLIRKGIVKRVYRLHHPLQELIPSQSKR
jgi:glycosyltransferase involved in cell wall biosynthesis